MYSKSNVLTITPWDRYIHEIVYSFLLATVTDIIIVLEND
jgi:hypothetical protein